MTVSEKPPTEAPAWARERAEMVQGIYIHALMYFVINGGLVLLNWATRSDGGAWWSLWVMAIWGIGLVIHLVVALVPVFGSEWVERRARGYASKHQS